MTKLDDIRGALTEQFSGAQNIEVVTSSLKDSNGKVFLSNMPAARVEFESGLIVIAPISGTHLESLTTEEIAENLGVVMREAVERAMARRS